MAQYSSLQAQSHIVTSSVDDGQASRYLRDDGNDMASKTPLRVRQSDGSASPMDGKSQPSMIHRIGWVAVLTMLSTFLVILGAVAFLVFAWMGNVSNHIWKEIMVRGWATRAVTIAALVVRTSVGLQAGIAVAMLASVLLESRSGARLIDAPMLSVVRATEAVSVFLLQPVWSGLTMSPTNVVFSSLLVLLIVTSTLLQFSSTVLVSDLSLGQLPGSSSVLLTAYDFAYNETSDAGGGSTYRDRQENQAVGLWQRPPYVYPAFAEYSEPIHSPAGVDDTGVILRAFPPFADAQSREALQNYSGKALVLDARVSCQPPDLYNTTIFVPVPNGPIYVSGSFLPSRDNVTGLWSPSTLWTPPHPVPFNCSMVGVEALIMCAPSNWDSYFNELPPLSGSWSGGLLSHWSNFTDMSTIDPYLRSFNVTQQLPTSPRAFVTRGRPWLLFSTKGLYSQGIQIDVFEEPDFDFNVTEEAPWTKLSHIPTSTGEIDLDWRNRDVEMNVTLCYNAWDTARLSVVMHSDSNRTEPKLSFDRTAHSQPLEVWQTLNITSQIPYQLGAVQNIGNVSERGILTLSTPNNSWIPAQEDRLTSNDYDSRPFMVDLATQGVNLGGHWGPDPQRDAAYELTALGGVRGGERESQLFLVDKTIRKLFNKALEESGSPAKAMSAVITLLSGMAYYDQMPLFDQNDTTTQTFFTTVLFPRSNRGLIAFLVVLATHLVLVAIAIIAFVSSSRFTFLGNYWQAIAQLRSLETEGILAESSMLKDREVEERLKQGGLDDVRVGLSVSVEDSQFEDGSGRVEFVARRRRPRKSLGE